MFDFYPTIIAGIDPFSWVMIALFAVSGAVSYVSYQKAKKAAQQQTRQKSGLLYQTRGSALPRRIPYGMVRLGGIEDNVAASGPENEYMHYILIWGEGPIRKIIELQFDGVKVELEDSGGGLLVPVEGSPYAGHVQIQHNLGTLDQEALGVGEIPEWTVNDKLIGIAHSWLRLKYNADKFPNGIPSASVVLEGRVDIYDPRDESTGYSTNPSLIQNHFMCLQKMGPGLDYDDDIGEDELVAAANACDEEPTINGGSTGSGSGGGGEVKGPRYTFNGVIDLSRSAEENIRIFRTSMAGISAYVGGRWRVYAGVYREPSFVIDKTNLVGPIVTRTRSSKRDRFNIINGVYVSPATAYQPTDFRSYRRDDLIAEDGEELPDDIELLNTESQSMCRRLAKIFLLRSRYSRSCTVQVDIEALEVSPGETCYLNFPELGYDMTPMDIQTLSMSITEGKISFSMNLKETNPLIYEPDPDEEGDSGATYLGTRFAPPHQRPGAVPEGGNNNESYYPDLFDIYQRFPGIQEVYCKARGGTATVAGFAEFTDASTPKRYYLEQKQSGSQVECFYNTPGGGGGCAEDACNDPTGIYAWLQFQATCNMDGMGYKIHVERVDFLVESVVLESTGQVSLNWKVVIAKENGGGGSKVKLAGEWLVYNFSAGTHTGTITRNNGTIGALEVIADYNSAGCGGPPGYIVSGGGDWETPPSNWGATAGGFVTNINFCIPDTSSTRWVAKGSAIIDPAVDVDEATTDNREKETIYADGCQPPMSGGSSTSSTDPFISGTGGGKVSAVIVARTTKTQPSTNACVSDLRITHSDMKVELLNEDDDDAAIARLMSDQPDWSELEWGDAMLMPPAGQLFTEDGCPSEWSGRGYGAYNGRNTTYLQKRVLLKLYGFNAAGAYKVRVFLTGRHMPTGDVVANKKVLTFETYADGLGNTEFEFDMPLQEFWRFWMSDIRYYKMGMT